MRYLLISSITFLILSCNSSSNNQAVEVKSQEYQDSIAQQATIINNNASGKTDTEVITDAALDLVEQAKEIAAAKRQSDSIKLATRESVWVYQIGFPKNSEEELWTGYDRVRRFQNVYAFKLSHNTYILIKNDFYSKQEIADSLAHFNDLLSAIGITDLAKPYDLMDNCKVKETVVNTDDIKVKKKQVIPCLVCH